MAIVLSRDVPLDGGQDLLMQRTHVETSRPLDCSRYAPIRAECRDRLGEAYEVANTGVGSKADEYMDVIGQDRASQYNR
jgi:hypothetical protein